MTFLPIAARELTVAARRPGTYRMRTYGVLIGLMIFWIVTRGNDSKAALGHQVLIALGVATLGFCMLAGLLLTADSIATEKEGGTIGLLFLTDLKGYDIVLGKLAAQSVSAYFGLLAVFPVLALPLLMGSVTGREFSRMLLVFGTTLFFSASLGLAVSAMTRDSKQALGWAIVLMGVATGFLPVLWRLQQMILHSAWLDFLLWPSPAFAFRHSFDAWYWSRPGKSEFWLSVQTLWLLSALCLAWASFITPRTWQRELEPRRLRKPRRKPRGWEEAEAEDPFCRVTIRDWAPSSLANTLLAAGVPIWVFFYIGLPRSVVKGGPPLPFLVCIFLGIALHIIVKLLMIVESVSRLNHDRNSGALELLLVTPLPVESIIMSQRKSLRAHFRMSLWTLALLNVAMMSWVFEYGPNVEMSHGDRWIFAELFVGGIVVLLTDFEALTWVGMWQGLSKRRAYKAVLSTVVQVLGSCWLFAFIFVFANPIFGSELDAATIFALWFLVGLVVDAICLVTGRRRLTKDFRDAASQRYDKVDRQAA